MSSLARNWQLVRHTEGALRHGAENLGNVPALLRALLDEGAWREFAVPNGETITYRRFSEFVTAKPPRGLGTDLTVINRIIADDTEVRDMVREAEKVGRGNRTDLTPAGDSPAGHAVGNDQTGKTNARLQRDHPEVFERVRTKQLSTNAAAVLAGIRPRRISVRTDNPRSVAQALRKHFTAEQLAELIRLLLTGGDES